MAERFDFAAGASFWVKHSRHPNRKCYCPPNNSINIILPMLRGEQKRQNSIPMKTNNLRNRPR
jgi:hypothetical protein